MLALQQLLSFLHLVTRPDRRDFTSQILHVRLVKEKKKKPTANKNVFSEAPRFTIRISVVTKQDHFTDQNKPATCSTSTGGSGVSSKQTRISRIEQTPLLLFFFFSTMLCDECWILPVALCISSKSFQRELRLGLPF